MHEKVRPSESRISPEPKGQHVSILEQAYQEQQREKDPDYIPNTDDPETPLPFHWIQLQGGKPQVKPIPGRKGHYEIYHNYPNKHGGTGAVVPTYGDYADNMNYICFRMPDGSTRKFPAALIWEKHGDYCNRHTKDKYERRPFSKEK